MAIQSARALAHSKTLARRVDLYPSCGKKVASAQEVYMPEQETLKRAREDATEGKAPSTQAGEFVREEMHHIREGKHGARSPQQAIAIGLSKARRAGVKLPPPARGRTSRRTRKQAQRDYAKGQSGRNRRTNPKRSRAVTRALKREPRSSASRSALSRQARSAARRRRSRA